MKGSLNTKEDPKVKAQLSLALLSAHGIKEEAGGKVTNRM